MTSSYAIYPFFTLKITYDLRRGFWWGLVTAIFFLSERKEISARERNGCNGQVAGIRG
jgi:hypothetical protein